MSKTSRIRDNSIYGTVAEFLQDKIQDGSDLSIVSAYFTIYAFEKLRNELTDIKELRFLFGELSFISIDPDKTESKAFQLTESGLKLQNYLPKKEVAKACANWIEEKVEIRSIRKSNFMHGKMYYIENDKTEDAIIRSSNFTVRGLGLSQTTYVLSNSPNISYCWKSALQAVETCVIIGYKGLIRMPTTFSSSKQTFPGSTKMSLLNRFSPRL